MQKVNKLCICLTIFALTSISVKSNVCAETNNNYVQDSYAIDSLKSSKASSTDKKDNSFNNIQNNNLVLKDKDNIYYVEQYSDKNFQTCNILYSMNKEGTKKVISKISDGYFSDLSIVDDYIYYRSKNPYLKYKDQDGDTIFKVKKDGSTKPEVLYKDVVNCVKMQIVGKDIYYSNTYALYKGNIDGGKPIEILNGIEDKKDNISFLVKDGWIYYWGFDSITSRETGVYKIKTDNSEKKCIVKNKDVRNMNVSCINISEDSIYYYSPFGRTYKSDLDGKNLKRLVFLNNLGGVNVFNGYIYYSYNGNIYKIKSDGLSKAIKLTSKDANTSFQSINIVQGRLYYYNCNRNMIKIDLN